jgi:hypothetical protein
MQFLVTISRAWNELHCSSLSQDVFGILVSSAFRFSIRSNCRAALIRLPEKAPTEKPSALWQFCRYSPEGSLPYCYSTWTV